jgi:hypothetical protein
MIGLLWFDGPRQAADFPAQVSQRLANKAESPMVCVIMIDQR